MKRFLMMIGIIAMLGACSSPKSSGEETTDTMDTVMMEVDSMAMEVDSMVMEVDTLMTDSL